MSGEGQWEGLSEQEEFERSNGSMLCRAQLIFGKCSGEDCRWEHNIKGGGVAPLCREHFLRKKYCPRMDACPLLHILSGITLPSKLLKEIQLEELRASLDQVSGTDGDNFSQQHVSKQQRDAAMAIVIKTRTDNRSVTKSPIESPSSVMDGGVSLVGQTDQPQIEDATDYDFLPEQATDPKVEIGRPDEGSTTTAGPCIGFHAIDPEYFGSGKALYNPQANYDDPRSGSAPEMGHNQQDPSWNVPMGHRSISSHPLCDPSPIRHSSYQGVGSEASRLALYHSDVMHEQRVMSYDAPPQPMQTQPYHPHGPNYQNNKQNDTSYGSGNSYQNSRQNGPFHGNNIGYQNSRQNGPFRGDNIGYQNSRQSGPFRDDNIGYQNSRQNGQFRGDNIGYQNNRRNGPTHGNDNGYNGYQDNRRNGFRGNNNGFQEYPNGGTHQNQFQSSHTTFPRPNNTGGSRPSFESVGQNNHNSGSTGGLFSVPVSASQTDPTPSNRKESKPGINIQRELIQVMRNTGGNIPAPRDVMNGRGRGRGRGGPFRGTGRFHNQCYNRGAAGNFNTSHPYLPGEQALPQQTPRGGQLWDTDPSIGLRQEQTSYNDHSMILGADRFRSGPSSTGGNSNHRGTFTQQQFTPHLGDLSFGTNTSTNSQREYPGYFGNNSTINRGPTSFMPNSGRGRSVGIGEEGYRYPLVGGKPQLNSIAIANSQGHNQPPDLSTGDGVGYPIERVDNLQDKRALHPPINEDTTVALVGQAPPNRRAGDRYTPINNGHQPKPAEKRTLTGPSSLSGDSHTYEDKNYYDAVQDNGPELMKLVSLRRGSGVHEPGIFHEPVDSSDSDFQSLSGRYTPEPEQLVDPPICHSPIVPDRSALRLHYDYLREVNHERNPDMGADAFTPEKKEWKKKPFSRNHEQTPTEELPRDAILQNLGQFSKSNAFSEENFVRNGSKPLTPPLLTSISPLTQAPTLPIVAALTPSLRAPAPPAPSLTPPAPSLTPPAPSLTPPAPSLTPPAPSLTPPAPSLTPPAPSLTPPAPSPTPTVPSLTPPAPSLTPPAPSLTPPAPSLTPPAPSLTPPAPSLTPPAPSLTPPAPSLIPPAPSLTPPAPSLTPPAPSLTPLTPSLTPPAPPLAPSLTPPAPSLAPPVPPLTPQAQPTESLPASVPSTRPPAPVIARPFKSGFKIKKQNARLKPFAPIAVPEGVPEALNARIVASVPRDVVPLSSPKRAEGSTKIPPSYALVVEEKPEVKHLASSQKKPCWHCGDYHEEPCQALLRGVVSSKTTRKRANEYVDDTWDFQGINKHWSDDEVTGKNLARHTGKCKRVPKAQQARDFPDQDDNGGVPLGKFMGAETIQSTKLGPKKKEKRKYLKGGVALGDSIKKEPVPEEFPETSKPQGSKSIMVRADRNHIGGYFDRGDNGIRKLPEDILMTIFSYLADGLMPEEQMETKNVHIGNSFRFDSSFTTTRYRRLKAVLRSCHYWRYLGQQIVCKYINLTKLDSFRRFVRTISEDEELGNMVRAIKLNIHGGASYISTHDRRLPNHTLAEAPKVGDLAQLFTRMMQSCPQIQVLSVNMHGSIQGFNVVFEKFPMMREIQIKDDKSKGFTAQNIWRNLSKSYPNLENFRIFHSQENVSANFDNCRTLPKLFYLKGTNEFILKALTMERCPEISDRSLMTLSPKLKNLTTLVIVDCKLVTSGGLARAIERLPDPGQITRLIYFVWVDPFGKSTPGEMAPTKSHLCTAIRNHCTNVSYLCWKPYRICGDFWKDSNFHALERCRIEPMSFKDCDANVDDYSKFTEAYKQAREEERLPKLEEDRVFFDFYF